MLFEKEGNVLHISARPGDKNRRLHPDDIEYFEELKILTFLVANHFGLNLKSVEPSSKPHPRFLGWCSHTGNIKLAIRARTTKGVWHQRYSDETIVHTIAHELAHLKHFDHGKDHDELTKKIKNFILFRK